MPHNKKSLLYTTVVGGSHLKTKLFDVAAWKDIGFEVSWYGLLTELQKNDSPSTIVINQVAKAVDALEEYLEKRPNLVESLGGGQQDPPPIIDVPARSLIRFMIVYLLDRFYHSSSPDQTLDYGNDIILHRHPKLILRQKDIKHSTTGGQYI